MMIKEEKYRTKYVRFMATDTFSPLFWDDEDVGIGYDFCFYIGDEEYDFSSFVGIKEWFQKTDKYDPYTDIEEFTIVGMEEWINQGYEYAKQILKILPKDIKLYYCFWHNFGDGKWRHCEAYIS